MSHVPPAQAVAVGEEEARVLLGRELGAVVKELKEPEVGGEVVFVKGMREEEREAGSVLRVLGDVIGLVLAEEDRPPEPEFVGRTKDLELLLNGGDELA